MSIGKSGDLPGVEPMSDSATPTIATFRVKLPI